jgi:hypothetical protein
VWPPAGKSITEIARDRALDIYHHHEPPKLPPESEQKLTHILREAADEFNGIG